MNPELTTFIDELGKKADCLLKGKMESFEGAGIRCPWLEWRKKRDQVSNTSPAIVGLLLMQDWGNQNETIESGIQLIDDASYNARACTDLTLRNLLDSGWKKPIVDQIWLVSNAVWGLRKKPKCGYLGDSIHKAAFPIWMKLVHRLSSAVKNGSFKLVVAGEWAVFYDEFKKCKGWLELSEYLKKWVKFTYKGGSKEEQHQLKLAEECQGRVYHVWHPATWRWTAKDLRTGPP